MSKPNSVLNDHLSRRKITLALKRATFLQALASLGLLLHRIGLATTLPLLAGERNSWDKSRHLRTFHLSPFAQLV